MKGASALVASVMLVLIALVASVFVSGWLSSTTEKQTTTIRNSSLEQILCQYADVYIRDARYNCGGDCSAGVTHILNLTVVNSGKRALSIDRLYIINTTGSVLEFPLSATWSVNVADIVTLINRTSATCTGINGSIEYVRINAINCPNVYDNYEGSRVTYLNC